MTLEEIRKAKEDAELAILQLLKQLEIDTGVGVQSIDAQTLPVARIGWRSKVIITGITITMNI